ncbi:MAG: CRISPR-associated endonuclease Cas2 [Patescibacteria group bacterium]
MGGYPSYGILNELAEMLSYKPLKTILRDLLFDKVSQRDGINKTTFARKMYDLQKGNFVTIKGDQVTVTKKGWQRIDLERIDKLQWDDKKQDGFFRLIIFDIPEKRRRARDILREKLREFECHQIQKSVFVTPYRCEEVMNELVKLLHVERHVHIIKAVHLGHDDAKVRKHFRK